MLKFCPTTPVIFYAQQNEYIQEQGTESRWFPIVEFPLYCEWKGSFGDRAVDAQAQGVSDSALVRMHYHPKAYEQMRSSRIALVKNATSVDSTAPDEQNGNTYELWGGVDNVREESQYMEFRVRRYENK